MGETHSLPKLHPQQQPDTVVLAGMKSSGTSGSYTSSVYSKKKNVRIDTVADMFSLTVTS